MQIVSISITDKCTNRCPSCISYKGECFMSLNGFKLLVRKLPKVKDVVFTGGEPFLHPQVDLFAQYCAEKLVKPTILTSGTAVFDFRKIRDCVRMVILTIKYPNDYDDEWKSFKGSFSMCEKKLGIMKELGIPSGINWAVDRLNFMYMEEMAELAEKYGARLFMLRFLPYHKGMIDTSLTNGEWEMVCEEAVHNGIDIAFPSRLSYFDCLGGVQRAHISCLGEVFPCMYAEFEPVGNIFKSSWDSINDGLKKWRIAIGNMKNCPVLRRLEFEHSEVREAHV